MTKVVLDLTMSLDGFIAGPNINPKEPLGEGGERLHDWLFKNKTEASKKILDETVQTSGAVIVGGRTYFDAIDTGWGGKTPFVVKAIVVSNRKPDKKIDGFVYVSDTHSALAEAKKAAGEKNIWLMGGADIAQQFIRSRQVDEIHIHIAHVLLGAGTRLFDNIGKDQIELKQSHSTESPGVTHLRFTVVK